MKSIGIQKIFLFVFISIFQFYIISPTKLYSQTEYIKEIDSNFIVEIDISIYNNNIALINEVREIVLPAGISELRFTDISRHLQPSSVILASKNLTAGFEVIEQSYQYDLLTPQNIMEKYVGKKIKLIEEIETGEEKISEAELISFNQEPIYRIGNEIHIGHPGRVVLPELPKNIFFQPTLISKVSSKTEGKHPLEVTYLTQGLNWEMDYSLILNSDETRADIIGRVTINNSTNIHFKKAKIHLIAGDINKVQETQIRHLKSAFESTPLVQSLSQEDFFEYHLYNFPGNISLPENQIKQVRLLEATRVPVKKELRYYGEEYLFRHKYVEMPSKQRVGVYLEFENKKTFHLGIPLPQGNVRSYKKDTLGQIQFIGEDRITHIPENEKIQIHLGYAFDITLEKRQLDWEKISPNIIEVTWEITIRNSKEESVWIIIFESVPGDWDIIEKTHQWKKEDSHTLRFDISITPKGIEKLKYKVRITL